jgi:hypothetical protein
MNEYTGINILIGSHLSHAVVKTKLVPRLENFIPTIEEELNYGLEYELPECKNQWADIDFNKTALHVISRITARLFVGLPLCRDTEWVTLNEEIVPEIFTVGSFAFNKL